MDKRKSTLLSIICVIALMLLVTGITYAAYQYSIEGSKANTISTGIISMSYLSENNGITLDNMWPIDDNTGKGLANSVGYCSKANSTAPYTPYNEVDCEDNGGQWAAGGDYVFDFTVSATLTQGVVVAYEIAAIKQEGATLLDDEIKLYLEKSIDNGSTYTSIFEPEHYIGITETTAVGSPSGSMILDAGNFTTTSVVKYRLRMWLADTYEVENLAESETYSVKINVYGKVTDLPSNFVAETTLTSTDLNENKQITIPNGEFREIAVNLANNTTEDLKANFYYNLVSGSLNNVSVNYEDGTTVPLTGEGSRINSGENKNYYIIIYNNSGASTTLQFNSDAALPTNELVYDNSINREVVTPGTVSYDESGASVPELVDGMIPVIYEATSNTTGNWVKADTTKTLSFGGSTVATKYFDKYLSLAGTQPCQPNSTAFKGDAIKEVSLGAVSGYQTLWYDQYSSWGQICFVDSFLNRPQLTNIQRGGYSSYSSFPYPGLFSLNHDIASFGFRLALKP